MKLFDLSRRVAVVIGGTSGLGKAIAFGLAEAGADTIATGRRANLVEEVCNRIQSFGVRSLVHPTDVQDPASLESLKDEAIRDFGRVDILINAAGRTFKKPTINVQDDEWNDLLDTNVTGALRACRAFYEPLKASGNGRIVNIASLASFVAFHEVAAYGASKSALLSLTRSLGCEWAKDGIRTNAVVPGVIVTDLNRDLLLGTERGKELLTRTPLGRFGNADEVVGAALFLSSNAASFITGTSIVVDGGFLASGVNA